MDNTTIVYQLAVIAPMQPEAVTLGNRLVLRGRCSAGLAGRLIDALCRYWRDQQGQPAMIVSASLSDGRWAVIAEVAAEELHEDHLDRVALATCLLFGIDWRDGTSAFMGLLDQADFRELCWQALAEGKAGPQLVAAVLAA